MVHRHKKIDRNSLILVAAIAALHLWLLHQVGWKRTEPRRQDDIHVVIDLAANRPEAVKQVPMSSPEEKAPAKPAFAKPAQATAAQAVPAPASPAAPAAAPQTPPPQALPVPTPSLSQAPSKSPPMPDAVSPVSNSGVRDNAEDAPLQSRTSRVDALAAHGADLPSTNAHYEVGSKKNPRPPYPLAAFLDRIEGQVILRVHVMANGKPAEIQLLRSSGSPQLDKSALDTLAGWELQPARKNGEAIDQWIEIPIFFRVLKK